MIIDAAAITMSGAHEPIDQVLARVLRWTGEARAKGATVVFFPELILGHYHEVPVSLDGPEVTAVRKCAQNMKVAVAIGVGECRGDALYSSYVFCMPDGSMAVHRKTRWQTPECPIALGSDLIAHDLGGLKAGVMICAETRFPDVAQLHARSGAQLLIMPHAYGKGGPSWQPLSNAIANVAASRSREAHLPAIVIAATGEDFEGGFALINSRGGMVCMRMDEEERLYQFRMTSEYGEVSLQAVSETWRAQA